MDERSDAYQWRRNPGLPVTLRSQPMAAYMTEFVNLLALDSARCMRGVCASAATP